MNSNHEKAKTIKVLFLDVDGVLTSGHIYYSPEGETLKQFNTLDGQGLKYLMQSGVVPVVVSGRSSQALAQRLQDLGFEHVHLGVHDKLNTCEEVLKQLNLTWQEAAAMGDDWPDLPMLVRSALSAAPQNAHMELKTRVDVLTQKKGGDGALRELCDFILKAKGCYEIILKPYIQ